MQQAVDIYTDMGRLNQAARYIRVTSRLLVEKANVVRLGYSGAIGEAGVLRERRGVLFESG